MSNSIGLLAALGGLLIVALFSTFVFNMSRSRPNSILMRSDLAASLTALMITTLIVFSFALVASQLYKALPNIALAFGGAVALQFAASFFSWFFFGVKSQKTTGPTVGGKLPGAPA